MKITVLGTGDAIGTPKIGCSCPRCSYALHQGIARLRTSFLIEHAGKNILIDSSPDLRQQLLAHGSPHIDAVIWTHGHFDHFMGFGEFYRVQAMPAVYAAPQIMEYCAGVFQFLSFSRHAAEPFCPVDLFGLGVTLVPVNHPPAETYGIILTNGKAKIAFTSDSNADIPAESLTLFSGADLFFVDALVPPSIHIDKHMNYQEACTLSAGLKVKDFRCVHMSHNIPWDLPNIGKDGEIFCF
jgi:phosphoribosyl 1,2-cyclic phosphate phosphodiesterase